MTRTESMYANLRADILGGRLEPGRKLPFAELTEAYGVSVGPLREALYRLVEQGLVELAPQHGFSVISLSRDDLVDLTVARADIECLTLRHAVADGGLAWESDVLAAHHRLAGTPLTDGDPDRFSEQWITLHNEFHETLLRGCANRRLISIAVGLRVSAELYQRWSMPLGRGHNRDIPAEHRAIADAVLAGDADRACRLLAEHIMRTTTLLLDSGSADAVLSAEG